MIGPPDTRGRAGDVGEYAGPAHRDHWRDCALGHSRASHEAFGWCCLESDRTVGEEVWAWRLKHQRESAGRLTLERDIGD